MEKTSNVFANIGPAVNLPLAKPVAMGALSEEELNAEIEKGYADFLAGRVVSAESVAENVRRRAYRL